MSRPPLPYVTAYLQFSIAIIFVLGYFGLLYMLFSGNPKIPDNLLELAKTLAIGLSSALGLLFAFLYLRSRVDSAPDASTSVTKTTAVTGDQPPPPAA